ncbi:MAG: hypothetical protein FWD23_14025 [Oscillospiraceae bacterium]|nr:hypothetical protein [Oscillospiraceae bacterium]
MKKSVVFTLLMVVCVFISACSAKKSTDALIEMQMVYDENPAHWYKDMKLIWGDTAYYVTNVKNPKPGKQIGYAADEYDGWHIYELKGHGRKYLYAVEKNNEDCWRVMSVYPPEQPWRQYILENATDREKFERMMSVTLYKDGTAELATPPISSYAMFGTYYYAFENDELLIFQKRENITAHFTVLDDNTLVFVFASVPLYADKEARYVRLTEEN